MSMSRKRVRRQVSPTPTPTLFSFHQSSRSRSRSRTRCGFTLVEMLIVVTILGILASVILPSMNSTSSVIGLEAAARTLAADLRITRHSAVQYNSSYQVQIDLTANTYQIVFVGTGSVPTLTNLLNSSSSSGNSIDFDQWSASRMKQARIALAGAALKTSKTNVTNVAFGPAGGTGPSRTEDTVFWLTQGSGNARLSVLVSVSWLTGNVTVGDVATFPTNQTRPTF